MSTERAAAPLSVDMVEARLGEESLRLVGDQLVKVFVSLLVVDAFLVWLLARHGLLGPALAWSALQVALQGVRWHILALHKRGSASTPITLRRLLAIYAAMGCGRAAILPLLFTTPAVDSHYIFTMVLVGQLAGAVGSVAGLVRAYIVWATPVALVTAMAWWAQGSFEGRWIGVLVLLMTLVLTSYVAANARSLAQLVETALEKESLAGSLRRERDLVQQASDANRTLADSLAIERDRAEAASQSKTRFFAAASHDLRQPLHALSINATTLEVVAGRQSDPMIKELSQGINRALQQSNGLLDNLLDISRLDAGAVQLTRERVDVLALLRSVAEDFAASAGQRGITLVVDDDQELGRDTASAWASTDFDSLLRVVNNLVSNALKFTSKGGVYLSARNPDDTCASETVITVRDTGCGIPVDEQERVFEEFYQVGNPSRDRDKGLGLGLSIVRRSATLLGARLTLRSEPGHGTCVALTLPADTSMESMASRAQPALSDRRLDPVSAAIDAGARIDLRGARILVIDDEPEITRSVTRLLEVWGCECRSGASLADAVTLVEGGFAAEALVVDHRLREETGGDVILAIRERLPALAAFLVTGDTSPETLRAMSESGCRVVHKPVDGGRLAAALNAALAEAADARGA